VGILGREVRSVQNPAIGATLIATATRGFSEASTVHAGMPLPLAFLVLPIILHAATNQLIASTMKNSGLRYFADKFGWAKNAQPDLILAIQSRALSLRPTTFEALDLMFRSGLANIDRTQATIFATQFSMRCLATFMLR
jgi:ABC-three component (ABC-3C) system Middle Component 3